MISRWTPVASITAALLGLGCSAADGLVEPVATVNEAITIFPSATDPNLVAGYSWNYPATTKYMQSPSTHICFLTGIQGLFKSANDSVSADRVAPGVWALSGTVGTGLPGGRSYCAAASFPGGYDGAVYSWTQEQGSTWTDMGTATNRTCFLTRVKGRLSNDQNYVISRIFQGKWWLHGNATMSTDGVAASAMCINRAMNPNTNGYTWSPGSPLVALPLDSGGLPLDSNSPTSPRYCALTVVGGNFLTRNTNKNNQVLASYENVHAGPVYGWRLRGDPGPSHYGTFGCLR